RQITVPVLYPRHLHDALAISGGPHGNALFSRVPPPGKAALRSAAWKGGATCRRLERRRYVAPPFQAAIKAFRPAGGQAAAATDRSEEHTSELQSPCNLVCAFL